MTIKHKHYDVIVAFAEGKIIQCKFNDIWRNMNTPMFKPDREYRVKPEPEVLRRRYTVWTDDGAEVEFKLLITIEDGKATSVRLL